jgi:hypothetical protein
MKKTRKKDRACAKNTCNSRQSIGLDLSPLLSRESEQRVCEDILTGNEKKGTVMPEQSERHIAHLETRIKSLSGQLLDVADGSAFDELLILMRRPGWTTPAEILFVDGIVNVMREQVQSLASLKQVLLSGGRAVELNPQPLPPKAE